MKSTHQHGRSCALCCWRRLRRPWWLQRFSCGEAVAGRADRRGDREPDRGAGSGHSSCRCLPIGLGGRQGSDGTPRPFSIVATTMTAELFEPAIARSGLAVLHRPRHRCQRADRHRRPRARHTRRPAASRTRRVGRGELREHARTRDTQPRTGRAAPSRPRSAAHCSTYRPRSRSTAIAWRWSTPASISACRHRSGQEHRRVRPSTSCSYARARSRPPDQGRHQRADTRQAFDSIESAGQQALVELRRLLGIAAAEGEAPALAPQPGLQPGRPRAGSPRRRASGDRAD